MIAVGIITKDRMTVKVKGMEQGMTSLQLSFDPLYLGLEHCPTCGVLVEHAEAHHFGECMLCFRASMG